MKTIYPQTSESNSLTELATS